MTDKATIKGILTAIAVSLYIAAVFIMPLPLSGTMAFVYSTFLVWIVIFIPSIVLMRRNKETLSGIGFRKQGMLWQILIGVAWGFVSLLLFIIPSFFGLVDIDYSALRNMDFWWILQVLVHGLLFVALVEEVIFRGHLYNAIKGKSGNIWPATLVTSVLFGLIHLPSAIFFSAYIEAVYIIGAMIFGAVCCLMREKMKHCSMLSLIIAHAVHNSVMYGIFFTS